MPSNELTKTSDLLDSEIDRRDWIAEFRVESAVPPGTSRLEPDSLFTVVEYRRPAPIILPESASVTETRPPRAESRHPVLRRVKRAFSPTLAALVVLYVAVVFMTAWIGFERGTAARSEMSTEGSMPAPAETWGPSND
jgi:hypothetical protein